MSTSKRNAILGSVLAILGIVAAFLAGMYAIHPATLGAITTTATMMQTATATHLSTTTEFSTATTTQLATSTAQMTMTEIQTQTSTSTVTSLDGCSVIFSMPRGQYNVSSNVTVNATSSCSGILEASLRDTHWQSSLQSATANANQRTTIIFYDLSACDNYTLTATFVTNTKTSFTAQSGFAVLA